MSINRELLLTDLMHAKLYLSSLPSSYLTAWYKRLCLKWSLTAGWPLTSSSEVAFITAGCPVTERQNLSLKIAY